MIIVILQIVLAILGLGATLFAWWMKAKDAKEKEVESNDEKIDAANSADDIIHESGELR